jgi:hypothetical protein
MQDHSAQRIRKQPCKEANKVLKKAQSEKSVTLKFPRLGKLENLRIIVYTDSSYRNSKNKENSVGGRYVALANKEGNVLL